MNGNSQFDMWQHHRMSNNESEKFKKFILNKGNEKKYCLLSLIRNNKLFLLVPPSTTSKWKKIINITGWLDCTYDYNWTNFSLIASKGVGSLKNKRGMKGAYILMQTAQNIKFNLITKVILHADIHKTSHFPIIMIFLKNVVIENHLICIRNATLL